MIHVAKVTLYARGQELKVGLLTEPELMSVIECVDELFRTYGSRIFFHTELDADEDALIVRCFEETPDGRDTRWIPFPKEWETRTVPFANRKVYALIGDRIPIAPEALGLSPWDHIELKIANWEED